MVFQHAYINRRSPPHSQWIDIYLPPALHTMAATLLAGSASASSLQLRVSPCSPLNRRALSQSRLPSVPCRLTVRAEQKPLESLKQAADSTKEQDESEKRTAVGTIPKSGTTIPRPEVERRPGAAAPIAEFSKRVLIASLLERADGGAHYIGHKVVVGGWVKTGRLQAKNTIAFLELNDGSTPVNLQVIVEEETAAANHLGLSQLTQTGTCVMVEGELKQPPEGADKQKVELKVLTVLHLGAVDTPNYPIAKIRYPLNYLRNFVHLRARTNTISAVARIRNALAFATHRFFQERQFLYVQTPIITTSDCEGAGEMFQVTTLLSEAEKREREARENPPPAAADVEAAKKVVAEQGALVRELKSEKKSKSEVTAAVQELTRLKEELGKLEERLNSSGGIPRKEGGGFDHSDDFFGRQAYLTVSGQLQVETYACALSRVYTFGPTFRAENSNTTRHLAEFWMIEPEISFADLEDDMNCAEAYVKYLCQYLLDHCPRDMEFFNKNFDDTALSRLQLVASTPFERLTYTSAIDLLKEVPAGRFENNVEWGIDLASEHERYLAEEVFKKPVIVYNYPKGIKAFYMRLNDDGKTVAAMDVLCPKIGELIGGSQREERVEVLVQRLKESGLDEEPYQWYLDLRRHGTVKHAGFGLGFERMVLFVTGLENIRDVIPFPRYPGKADL